MSTTSLSSQFVFPATIVSGSAMASSKNVHRVSGDHPDSRGADATRKFGVDTQDYTWTSLHDSRWWPRKVLSAGLSGPTLAPIVSVAQR